MFDESIETTVAYTWTRF